jgi:hypothetical protein
VSTFVPAADCVHVEASWLNTNLTKRMDVGLDFSLAAGTPVAYSDVLDMAAAVNTAATTNINPKLTDATLQIGVRVTALDTETSPSAFYNDGTHAGGVGGNHASPQLAAVIKFATGRRGPSGRGRIFVGCLPSSALLSTGELDHTFGANLLTAVQAWINGFMASGAWSPFSPAHVVLSRFHVITPHSPPVPRSSAIISPVEDYGINPFVMTQRRRAPR